jgi:hypothetical protein
VHPAPLLTQPRDGLELCAGERRADEVGEIIIGTHVAFLATGLAIVGKANSCPVRKPQVQGIVLTQPELGDGLAKRLLVGVHPLLVVGELVEHYADAEHGASPPS